MSRGITAGCWTTDVEKITKIQRRYLTAIENDDFDLRERVGAYQNFIEESKELAVNREIAEYQKMYDFRAATDLQIKALSDTGVQTAAKVSEKGQNQAAVQDYMRGMGQAIVEQAAKKKIKTVTDDAKRTDKLEQTREERVLNETS